MYKVDNAIIMAAGTSSRFAPLSYEKPKALIEVKGEILIERQICQLKEVGIDDIIIVVGYLREQFDYLIKKFGVKLVINEEYAIRNNHSSIFHVQNYLKNSYICSADNYFSINPFERYVDDAYYATLYSSTTTQEWCVSVGTDGYIDQVAIGGEKAWYMFGHAFWNQEFSLKFIEILNSIYLNPSTRPLFWEDIYSQHLNDLKLRVRKYRSDEIYEFDSLDELRIFDTSYIQDTRSCIMKLISTSLNCKECDIINITPHKNVSNEAIGFFFNQSTSRYLFNYETNSIERCCDEK